MITIVTMLMLANLAFLASEIVFMNELKTEKTDEKMEVFYGLRAVGLLLINVSYWMFAYKYFFMARQLPFKLAKREVPRNVVICDQITNRIFLSLNIIPPIFFGLGEIVYYAKA